MGDLQSFYRLLNGFFDHIYVITLRRAAERHDHLRRELSGLDYEIFYGRDKHDFMVEDLVRQGIYDEKLARQNHRFGKPLVPGMIGCSWSHLEIYEDLLRKGYRNALILEDDVEIDRHHASRLRLILDELPADWELLYLGYARHEPEFPLSFFKKTIYHFQRIIGRHKFTHTMIRNLYPVQVTDHILRAGYHDQTHAYAITRSAAGKLASLQRPISFIADNLLAYAVTSGLVTGYITHPKLVNQQSQGSRITRQTYISD